MHESRPEQQQIKLFGTEWDIYTHQSTTAVSPFLYCFTMSWWVGGSLFTCSFLFFGLGAAAAAHNISTEAERGTAYCFFLLRLRYYYCCLLCVYSIAVAAVEKGYAF